MSIRDEDVAVRGEAPTFAWASERGRGLRRHIFVPSVNSNLPSGLKFDKDGMFVQAGAGAAISR